MRKILAILATGFILASLGCTNYQQLSNAKGQKAFCKTEAFGVVSVLVMEEKFKSCVAGYEAKGFSKQ